ncbi:hypothetical protein SRABI36_04181 [Pedobacter sp. Bi36]|nr:hypothetical protein SRABI126_00969 [Pedobacter sp. Bi126]CAH0286741.1 hypothetical protein SRABI36_04181 [Pedobacter sp. Bi36]
MEVYTLIFSAKNNNRGDMLSDFKVHMEFAISSLARLWTCGE